MAALSHLPGMGIHERCCSLSPGRTLVHDLVDLILAAHHNLLQPLDDAGTFPGLVFIYSEARVLDRLRTQQVDQFFIVDLKEGHADRELTALREKDPVRRLLSDTHFR